MHSIYHFKAWEVRNPMLQMMHDLDLKRRSYGRLKTDYAKVRKFRTLKSKVRKILSKVRKFFQSAKMLQASKWAAKMFFFSLWLQDMASKLQNDMQKHFAKPRKIAKMPTEPHNHASKEESPFTEITHEVSHSISYLLKPSQPIAPAESSS